MSEYQAPYTRADLEQYCHHVNLPTRYHPSSNPKLDVKLLTALHKCQIAAFPYENLDLHYSNHHSISLDPTVIWNKLIIKGHNRGGYCMENSLFFLWILQAYGFDVYPTGVRIRLREDGVPKGIFHGLVHIILIVTFEDGTKYITDVAFGGDGQTSPQRLVEDQPVTNLGTQENRYVYSTLDQLPPRKFSTPQKFWIWQYRNSPSRPWNAFYCFTETEFLLGDYDVMNWYTSAGKTFQRTLLLIIKFLREDDDEEEPQIVGKLMLVNNLIKRNMGGKTEVVQECRTEGERIEALGKWFGIELTEEERVGIKGLVTEIHPPEEGVLSV